MVSNTTNPVDIAFGMYPTDIQTIKKDIQENYDAILTKKFGLKANFLNDIVDIQYDSQLVMVLATLVEGIVFDITNMELVKVTPPYAADNLQAIFCGKNAKHYKRIELLEKAGVLYDKEALVLKMLATIRNKFAHKPENLTKNLNDFYAGCGVDLQKQVQESILYITHHRLKLCPGDKDDHLAKNFRTILLMATLVAIYNFINNL